MNDIYRRLEEERRRAKQREENHLLENLATSPSTWEEIVQGLGRNTYPLALLASTSLLSLDELAKAIDDAWTMPDNPQGQLSQPVWLDYFERVGYLENGTRRPRPLLPITVWRGSVSSRRRRWSWTSDLDRAAWFATRLTAAGLDGRVWTTIAPPYAQLAHFYGVDSRNEDEHVVNTKGLKITEHPHE